jgi:hypothetical protein
VSRLQWAAVGAVLALGIVSQVPRHDHEHMPGHDNAAGDAHDDMSAGVSTAALATTPVPAGHVRVLLDISGMT